MGHLRLDHVDLLALHGINNREVLERALKPDGSLDMALKLRDQGRCRHVGFSTHAPLDVILAAIETDAFDYCNIHWYYFDQHNAPAIDAARAHDMGLFIISPADKGGQLYAPPPKLAELCAPLHPMVFNSLFCLARDDVHTLSIGAARPSDFAEHLNALPHLGRQDELLPPIIARLEAEAERVLGAEWVANWQRQLPDTDRVPGTVNLYHVLRLYNLSQAYDMVDFAKMRYNLFGNGGHWFYGNKVDQIDWDKLPEALADSPVREQIPGVLRRAHELLNAGERKRLSEGG
jgi:predicted aldo/keto reductase-like oxidoreductase